ncbi:signal peptidase I [Arthrobacter monumenti]
MSSSEAASRGVLRIIGRVATNVAVVAGFALAALFLVPGLLGFERYVITGGSMSGTFERGSLVFEQTAPVAELKVGDIITYMPPPESGINELVTHRIVSIKATEQGPQFRTRGDANAVVDHWTFMLEGPTQARFEVAVPYVGWALIALADDDLRMIIIGVPAAVIGLMSILEVVRVLREPKVDGQPLPVAEMGAKTSI